MVFSSVTFLFAFLPIVMTGYFVIKEKYKNIWLLAASLVFYAWNDPRFLWILLFSIGINYSGALFLEYNIRKRGRHTKTLSALIVIFNLLILFYFKYLNFTTRIINDVFNIKLVSNIVLPIGISFFTFQCISYVTDVAHERVTAQKNIISFAMYVSMFPQLVAGPIVRYSDICGQINDRRINLTDFAEGLSRFIIGLFKKIMIADCLGKAADGIFCLENGYRTALLAWVGIITYTLQIYFDFSGYSDMAIGLGRMLGFRFGENFNFPYISKSITEFWRRWHISLTSFFRDYVYIPLGGNRKFVYRNIAIIFLLTGIWHGADYTFIIWGIWHGFFQIIERLLRRAKKPAFVVIPGMKTIFSRVYTMLTVMIGWVFFRAESVGKAIQYIKTMFRLTLPDATPFSLPYYMNRGTWLILAVAVIWSTPLFQKIGIKIKQLIPETGYLLVKYSGLIVMLILCMLRAASGTYSAFIYFQF